MSNIYIQSLQNRIRAMNLLWDRAIRDVTLEQVNHHERDSILPIAFSLSHALRGQDWVISNYSLDESSLWERGDWAKRVAVTVDRPGSGRPVEEMELLRFGDLAAWAAYQTEVIARTDGVLARLTEKVLLEIVLAEVPKSREGFVALLVGVGNPVRKLDALESYVYQHGLRHLGELEHARSLVGLHGLAG